jgi:hypothetical protein
MCRTLALIGAAAASLLVFGCRNDSNPGNPAPDLSSGNMDLAGTPEDAAVADMPRSNACTTYAPSSIASMRQGKPGCFELDSVVAIALTPSTKSPRLFIQDSAGGPFSAIMTKCSSTSTSHPCTVASTVANTTLGHAVTVQGTYIRSNSTMFEEFFVDTIMDKGAGTPPAPGAAVLTDIESNSKSRGLAFQKVTTTIAAADTLLMYDWTPSEFVYTGATKCPYQFGWAMIPMSVAGATPGAACPSGNASQPATQTNPNAAQVLIGTDFYNGFHVSSDCRCTAMFQDKQPTANSKVVGAITGLLVFDVPFGSTTSQMYLAPQADADFPITNTQ